MLLVSNLRAFKTAVLVGGVFSVAFLFYLLSGPGWIPSSFRGTGTYSTEPTHPIDILIQQANEEWQHALSKDPADLPTAVEQYRGRRGRHPPPGFAEWYDFAKSQNALIVEDFFDQIYEDLRPYWGLDPSELQRQARGFEIRIVVRNHNTTMTTDKPRDWMESWFTLVQSIEEYLPNLDIPINVMDESRIIVPWEDLSHYLLAEQSSRQILPEEEVITDYIHVSEDDQPDFQSFEPVFKGSDAGPFWDLAKAACPEWSPSRHSNVEQIDFSSPPPEFYSYLHHSYHGYVSNWTWSKDVCSRPELRALHGSFIEPISISTSPELFPLFGGSKLSVNNEILLPPAMYWADNELYSGGKDEHGGAWDLKQDKFFWRGAATGGRNRESNWRGFQRHRFLAMTNGTAVQLAETNNLQGPNFILPSLADYGLNGTMTGSLSDFLDKYSDAGFVHLVCYPYDSSNPHCPYTEPYFALKEGMPMKEQYSFKYLPDIDGNSFSGRYRGFLLSTSLPIKSTIYQEWHDSRLFPWVHFVPMDATFMDVYGIMAYFLGYNGQPGHDYVAQKIALDGKAWSERVLRKVDMQIYTYRLLLEYARLCSDQRDRLGYVHERTFS